MLPWSREWRIAYACFVLRLLGVVAPSFSSTALIRLFEATVCREYYRRFDNSIIDLDDMVPEMKCKIAGVQSEMSNLSGIDSFISLIPMLIGALPYLVLTRIANKRLLLLVYYIGFLSGQFSYLAILYFYNTFDIRLIWLVNFFTLIGGGHIVFRALVSSIAAEALPKESLTSYYLYQSAVLLIIDCLASVAGLQLMQVSPWSAAVAGFGFYMLSVPVLLFLEDDEPLRPHGQSFWTDALDIRKQGRQLLATAQEHSVYIIIFLAYQCGKSVLVLLPQWLSKRLERTLREIGFIQVGQQILASMLFMALPKLQNYLTHGASKRGGDSYAVSLTMARWSIGCSIIGTMLLSLTWTLLPAIVALLISATGFGFYDILLGAITGKMDKSDLAQVYMCISLVEDVAGRMASTIIFTVYGLAVKMESFIGMSLPLWMCTGFFIWSLFLVRRL